MVEELRCKMWISSGNNCIFVDCQSESYGGTTTCLYKVCLYAIMTWINTCKLYKVPYIYQYASISVKICKSNTTKVNRNSFKNIANEVYLSVSKSEAWEMKFVSKDRQAPVKLISDPTLHILKKPEDLINVSQTSRML